MHSGQCAHDAGGLGGGGDGGGGGGLGFIGGGVVPTRALIGCLAVHCTLASLQVCKELPEASCSNAMLCAEQY